MSYYRLTDEETMDYLCREHRRMLTEIERNKPAWNAFAAAHDLVELKSDYLGMDSYFFDRKTRTIYKRHNTSYTFSIDNDPHILRYNNL